MLYQKVVKRALDIIMSIVALPFFAVLLPFIVMAIRLDSPGAAIFTQVRVGLHGRKFTLFKFRSMVSDATTKGAGYYFEENDPRITKVGAFLRKTSLDELPQILNVLKGDMSFVGPRPQLPFIVERYSRYYLPVLVTRPGLTGLAQVNGRTTLRRSQMVALDQEYVSRITFLNDLKIVIRTFTAVLAERGVKMDVSEEFLEDLQPDRV